MNRFADNHHTDPQDQLDDDALLNGGPVTSTGDDHLDIDLSELPF